LKIPLKKLRFDQREKKNLRKHLLTMSLHNILENISNNIIDPEIAIIIAIQASCFALVADPIKRELPSKKSIITRLPPFLAV